MQCFAIIFAVPLTGPASRAVPEGWTLLLVLSVVSDEPTRRLFRADFRKRWDSVAVF